MILHRNVVSVFGLLRNTVVHGVNPFSKIRGLSQLWNISYLGNQMKKSVVFIWRNKKLMFLWFLLDFEKLAFQLLKYFDQYFDLVQM